MAMGAEVNGNLVHKADATAAVEEPAVLSSDAGLAADGG
jgi:hypothetical protein